MKLPILTRQKPRYTPEQKQYILAEAIKVAQKPAHLELVPAEWRSHVEPLAKAMSTSSWNGNFRGTGRKPISSTQIAQRAAQQLEPSSSITPPEIDAALRAQGLDWVAPFAPGTPLTPFYGYGRRPRNYDYEVGYNVTTETRPDRLPYATLEHLWKAYDVAQTCTRYAISDLRSMRLRFTAMDGHDDNPVKEIAAAKQFLRKPDGVRYFRNWLAMNQRDLWIYDSAPIFKQKDKAGHLIGLKCIDAKTLAPMLDYYGDRPASPAPAYQQFIEGVPWDWLDETQIIYEPFWPQTDSPYGTPPLETVMVNANTDLRLQMYFLDFFTKGQVPEMFAIAPEGMTDPDALAELQETWNAWTFGDQAERWGLRWLPADTNLFPYKPDKFDPPLAEYVMRRTISAYGLTPQNLGILDDVNRATSETQMDQQFRVSTLPICGYYEDLLDDIIQNDLGLPVQVRFDTGREKEDRLTEAQAWAVAIDFGGASADEYRDKVLGLPIDPENPVPRYINSQRLGPVPLTHVEAISGELDPLTYAPAKKPAFQEYVIPGSQPGDDPQTAANNQDEGAQATARPKAGAPKGGASKGAMPGDPQPNSVANPDSPAPEDEDEPDGYGGILFDAKGSSANGTAAVHDPDAQERFEAEELDLARWRRNARKAVARGAHPRRFEDSEIRPAVADRVWEHLETATTREQVDMAFKAATAGYHSPRSGMVSLDVPPGLIPVMDGGVPDQHITVVFLGSDVDDDLFAEVCRVAEQVAGATPGPVTGTVGGVGSFEPSESSDWLKPVWAKPDVPAAYDLRKPFERFNASQHRDYHPHMTLAYMDPDDPLPAPLPDVPVSFTHLSVHRGGDVRRFPFGMVAKAQWSDFHHHTDEIIDHYTPLIEEAMAEVLNDPTVHQAIADAYHTHGTVEKAGAWRHLLQLAHRRTGKLAKVLRALWADAYKQGATEAAAASGGHMPPWAASVPPAPPGQWNGEWADYAQGGLADILRDEGIWIQGMTNTEVNRIGNAIERGIEQGFPVAQVTAEVNAIVNDEKRANMIAETEYARAMTRAARETYVANGVPMVMWLDNPGACPLCVENKDASPIPVSAQWPNGNVPVHPHCRCAEAPYYPPRRQP